MEEKAHGRRRPAESVGHVAVQGGNADGSRAGASMRGHCAGWRDWCPYELAWKRVRREKLPLEAIDTLYRRCYFKGGWGCGAAGSALEWHSRGQGFDPPQLHSWKARRDLRRGGPCSFRRGSTAAPVARPGAISSTQGACPSATAIRVEFSPPMKGGNGLERSRDAGLCRVTCSLFRGAPCYSIAITTWEILACADKFD